MSVPLVHWKVQLAERWNLSELFDELLGPGRNSKRSCWNKSAHSSGDSTPSLGYHPRTGAWRCWGCGEKGDLFTLYEKVQGKSFPVALSELLERYGIAGPKQSLKDKRKETSPVIPRLETGKNLLAWKNQLGNLGTIQHKEHLRFIMERYGLTLETILKYHLVYDAKPGSGRLLIPIPTFDLPPTAGAVNRGVSLVNIRAHDVFRTWCSWVHETTKDEVKARPDGVDFESIMHQKTSPWQPKWSRRSGKVIGEQGHNAPYVYPFDVLVRNPAVYVVGGELQALLLLQLGLPAISFTAGEATTAREVLNLFLGKRVRVLMDPDEAGVNATSTVARELADWGAYVEAGWWPGDVKKDLPPKGDVTDFLRIADWDPQALEYLTWEPFSRTVADPEEDVTAAGRYGRFSDSPPPREEVEVVPFRDIVDPTRLHTWGRFNAMISGRGEAPFAVPKQVAFSCPAGKKTTFPQCKGCSLPEKNFHHSATVGLERQLEFVNQPPELIEKKLREHLGVPVRCNRPLYQPDHVSVERVLLTPTIDYTEGVFTEYAHRQAFIVRPDVIQIRDNVAHEFTSYLLPDPVNAKFTCAIPSFVPADSDVLTYSEQPHIEGPLREWLSGPVEESLNRVVGSLRDHVVKIYQQDDMILSLLLGYVMPFQFVLGDQEQNRVCPAVMILGDTSIGKSTIANGLLRHYGAGRFASMEADPTFVGLVGGNIPTGGKNMAFAWGLIPTSHRGAVFMDEFAKVSLETVGKLTGLLSSGVAERTTASGTRKVLSHVRLIYMTNPRAGRDGKSLPLGVVPPMEDALSVMGSPQDLSRVEFVHVQYAVKDKSFFEEEPPPAVESPYSTEWARQHLSWMWSHSKSTIEFEDASYVRRKAAALAKEYLYHTLLLAPMAPFKVARIAAGMALLTYSTRNGRGLFVTNEHVDSAIAFLRRRYDPYLNAGEADLIPAVGRTMLLRIDNVQALKRLVSEATFTREDVKEYLGIMDGNEFLRVMHPEMGWLSKNGQYYKFREQRFSTAIIEWCVQRSSSK